jgi:hypothetical protein
MVRWLLLLVAACGPNTFAGVDRDSRLYGLSADAQAAICAKLQADYDRIAGPPDASGARTITCGAQSVAEPTPEQCATELASYAANSTCTSTVGDLADCDEVFSACDFFNAHHPACAGLCFEGW